MLAFDDIRIIDDVLESLDLIECGIRARLRYYNIQIILDANILSACFPAKLDLQCDYYATY